MADNIRRLDEAGGLPVATDEVTRNATTEHQQIVKIGLGAEGTHGILLENGQQLKANSVPVTLASDEDNVPVTLEVDNVGLATSANQTTANSSLSTIAGDTNSLDGKVTACDTDNITVIASALPTGAATAANQLPDGHNVTVDNASGASAVNIQDGGNVISVDDAGGSLTVDGAVAATQSGTWSVRNQDTSGNGITSGTNAADNVATSQRGLDGRAFNYIYDGTNWDRVRGDTTNGVDVDVTRSALPSGATTSANQTSAITQLTNIASSANSIDGNIATCDTDNVTVLKTAITASSPATQTIGTTSQSLVGANASRKGLIITNTHASNVLSLAFGTTAVAGSGIVLWPRDSFCMDAYSLSTAAINAVASAASTTVAVQEFT